MGEKSTVAEAPHRGLAEENDSLTAVKKLIRGRRPLIYLHTHEEERTFRLVRKAVDESLGIETAIFRWSATGGMIDGDRESSMREPSALLTQIFKEKGPTAYFLSDFHQCLHNNPILTRQLRELYTALTDTSTIIFICSAVKDIPMELESEMAYLKIELPGLEELNHLITKELQGRETSYGPFDEKDITLVSRTLQGLTYHEARHAFFAALASASDRRSLIDELQKEKKMEARKHSLVEYIPEVVPIEHIGGLENLKDWLTKRRSLMALEGAYNREIIPKGILLMGISGCGKSLSIKAIASLWELPLYRLDMVRVYSGAFGTPEDAFVRACETMERVSPAVLWIDEIEMGIQPGEAQAGGTTSRIFGFFLTWMQEKKPGLFLAATANRINLLPAEILRRGRFDQIFFIDLPTEKERRDIFRIHLERRGIDPGSFDLDLMVDLTDGCNGAEIEQCVISAIVEAKIAGHDPPTQKDLVAAKRLIVPLSKTMGEQVRHIRQWAFNRATPATMEKTS
jgi:ATP-dependent 26S proteasome regulatory subunit